jgi:di/tricarboxylate transporter
MTLDAWLTLAILVALFVMLIKTKLPAWIIFLGALTIALTLGLAPEEELLKGFSNSGVITVGALFMVAAGMYATGAITLVAGKLVGFPRSLRQAQLRILPPVAIGSAFLNNTPLVAMMIPVIRDLGRTAKLAVTRLYIPLSFASILGGASTLIGTSTNLIIAGLVVDQLASGNAPPGMRELNIFDPAVVGVPAAILGIAFIMLFSKQLLPGPKETDTATTVKRWYGAEFVVDAGSLLVGKTVTEAGLNESDGYRLVSIRDPEEAVAVEETDMTVRRWLQQALETEVPHEPAVVKKLRHSMSAETTEMPRVMRGLRRALKGKSAPPEPEPEQVSLGDHVLEGGQVLTFITDIESLPALWSTIGLTPYVSPAEMEPQRHTNRLLEVVVSPTSPVVGRRVSDLPLRTDAQPARLVALSRNGQPPDEPLLEVVVESGDVAVLEVGPAFLYENRNETDFTLTRRLRGYSVQRTERATIAMVIIGAMVVVATFGWLSMLNAALLATLALLLTGCLNLRTAGRSVEFGTLVVLAAAVGLESAVTASGLSAVIADLLLRIGGDNPYLALAAIFAGTALIANMTTNAAAAAVMFPISVSLAGQLDVNYMPFAIALMMGASAFISPTAYQTNLMVYGPGGYQFTDFVKIGLPLTALVGIVTVIMAPLVFGF